MKVLSIIDKHLNDDTFIVKNCCVFDENVMSVEDIYELIKKRAEDWWEEDFEYENELQFVYPDNLLEPKKITKRKIITTLNKNIHKDTTISFVLMGVSGISLNDVKVQISSIEVITP